jgi:hypothetical protein
MNAAIAEHFGVPHDLADEGSNAVWRLPKGSFQVPNERSTSWDHDNPQPVIATNPISSMLDYEVGPTGEAHVELGIGIYFESLQEVLSVGGHTLSERHTLWQVFRNCIEGELAW